VAYEVKCGMVGRVRGVAVNNQIRKIEKNFKCS